MRISASGGGTTALSGLSTDVSLSSVARGDLLYRGAATWNNLAAGTVGAPLLTGGASANPSWAGNLLITTDLVEQRRGANAQTFRVYGTYTDASNYHALAAYYTSGGAFWTLGVIADGTGGTPDLNLASKGGNLYFGTSAGTVWQFSNGNFIANGPYYVEMQEMSAPAAGAANTGRLFVVDSGGGKSVLKIQFATGSAQTIATEP